MLRLQQYIELVRSQSPDKLLAAIEHAQKYLFPMRYTYPTEVDQCAGLLAFPPVSGQDAYAVADDDLYSNIWSPARWDMLADIFTQTHHQLLALPCQPLLHMALSSGLSALKTPACHSVQPSSSATPSHATSLSASVCPICSTELNELARAVPYAHHSKSHVEHDLVLLPNGRVYGKQRLEDYAGNAGLRPGEVKDLRTGDVFPSARLKKVFIT